MSESIRQNEAGEPNFRPWDEPGAVRRDCEPHRGPWILFGGQLCLVLAVCSACLGCTAILAAPLGVIVWTLAQRDLALMQNGLMEVEGEEATREGRVLAIVGLLIALIAVAAMATFLVFAYSLGDK